MTEQERKEALKLIWRHTHKDYRGALDGAKTILVFRNGTCLVALDDLTDAEIAEKLPLAQKMEARRLAAKEAKQ